MCLNERGIAHYTLGQHFEAEKCFTSALIHFGVPVNTTAPNQEQQQNPQSSNHYDEGLNVYSNLLPIQCKASSTATLLHNLGQVHASRCNYVQAIDFFQKALDQAMIAMVVSGVTTSTTSYLDMMMKLHNNLGRCYFYVTGKKAMALRHYQQSLAIGIKCSMEQRTLATLLNCVGVVLFHLEDEDTTTTPANKEAALDRAMDLFRQSYAMYRQGLPTSTLSFLSSSSASQYVSEATILNNLGRVHYVRGNFKKAINTYQDSLKVRRRSSNVSGDCLNVAATLFNIGTTYNKLSDNMHAIQYLNEFIEIVTEHYNSSADDTIKKKLSMDIVHAYKAVAENQYEMKDTLKAIGSFEQGLTLLRSTIKNDTKPFQYQELLSSILIQLGNLSFEVKQFEDALKNYNEGLVIEKELYGKSHPNTIITMTNIGHIFKTVGQKIEALQMYQTVYTTIQRSKEDQDGGNSSLKDDRCFSTPFIAELVSHIGLLQYQMQDFEGAFESYQEALQLRRDHYNGDEHLDIASTLNSIGLTLFKQSSLDMAKECFFESLRIRKSLLGDTHRDLAILYYNIATVYYEQADSPDIALKYYNETLRIEKITLGEHHKDVAITLRHVGQVYQSLGLLDNALKCFHDALHIERLNNQGGPDNKNGALLLGQILNLIGNVYLQQGNTAGMMTSFVEVVRMYRECKIPESNLIIAGYNFYGLSKTQPPCAPVA